MARPVLRCQACRFSVLDVFTSLAGISLPARRPPPVSRTRALPPTSRSLYTSSRRLQNTETQLSLENDQPSPPTDVASPGENEPLPWYLAINDPLPPLPTAPSTLLTRQEIPSLPPSPPPILDPVLNHLSVAIGLENLTLLDLRSLYPPPALGANLLMIIGTARSVKHLNVSADRFCRWLRSTYKLRPYADGLLGRNELKIKLRRKARRLNLARAAGRLEADEAGRDDGMTTGWVCVNVGPVDDVVVPDATPGSGASQPSARSEFLAEQEQEEDDDADEYADEEDEYQNPDVSTDAAADTDVDDGYTGFGSRTTSQRIVVQMFTEEKRAEMNLEDLYANRNTRMQKRAVKADEGIAAREAREADLARAKAEKEAIRTRRKREQEQEQEQQMMEKAEQEARTAQAAGVPDEGERAEREKQDQANHGSKAKQQDADWAPFFKDIK